MHARSIRALLWPVLPDLVGEIGFHSESSALSPLLLTMWDLYARPSVLHNLTIYVAWWTLSKRTKAYAHSWTHKIWEAKFAAPISCSFHLVLHEASRQQCCELHCVCVAILAAASHNGRRRGRVACICSALKWSLPCQNLFIGVFSLSGSLEPCICFPLVASVKMMSFFLVILKYCFLSEKITHSFNGLINRWKTVCSIFLMLFTHFPIFPLFHSFSLSQPCSPTHWV